MRIPRLSVLWFGALFVPVLPGQSCIDQQFEPRSTANGLEVTGRQPVVQTFQLAQTGALGRIDLKLRRRPGVTPVPMTFEILPTDSAGKPVASPLVTETIPATAIASSGAYSWIAVRPTRKLAVTANTVLGVRLSVASTIGRAYDWNGDTGNPYTRGDSFLRVNTGPLSFDMGFRVYVGPAATTVTYGTGFPGRTGVPNLSATPPILGTDTRWTLGNSSGTATTGLFLLGSGRASLPTPIGGTVLLRIAFALPVQVPSRGGSLTAMVPDNPNLCGARLQTQLIVADPQAARGFAFSRGVELVFGL